MSKQVNDKKSLAEQVSEIRESKRMSRGLVPAILDSQNLRLSFISLVKICTCRRFLLPLCLININVKIEWLKIEKIN